MKHVFMLIHTICTATHPKTSKKSNHVNENVRMYSNVMTLFIFPSFLCGFFFLFCVQKKCFTLYDVASNVPRFNNFLTPKFVRQYSWKETERKKKSKTSTRKKISFVQIFFVNFFSAEHAMATYPKEKIVQHKVAIVYIEFFLASKGKPGWIWWGSIGV